MVISRFLQIVKKSHKSKDFMIKICNFLHLERKPIFRESQQGKKANPETKSIDAAKARDEVQVIFDDLWTVLYHYD